jgi:hypothetical protein
LYLYFGVTEELIRNFDLKIKKVHLHGGEKMGLICERCAEVEDAKEATVGLTLIVYASCRLAGARSVAIAAYAAAVAAHSPAASNEGDAVCACE